MVTLTVAAVLLGVVVALALYPAYISALARMRLGQRIQHYTLTSHSVKAGTPTIGGLVFVVLAVLAWVLFDRSRSGFLLAFALVAGAAIGILDDIDNVRGSRSLGLGAWQKLALQAVVGILLGVGLDIIGATAQYIPGLGSHALGWGIVPLAAFAVIAASNAVNLTDGVDGLAGSCSAIAVAALLVVAFHAHNTAVVAVTASLLGALAVFLLFNWYPARIFMGDTGSLALGCVLTVASAELHLLWLLPLLGIVFVIEALSVIINVTAIRRFHHRIFKASPLHHHFELGGVSEIRVVLGFSLVAAIAAVLTGLLGIGA